MKIATTTLDYLESGIWAQTPAEAVELFKDTGFRYLDFSFGYIQRDCNSPFFLKGDGWKKEAYDAANVAAKYGFEFVLAHASINHEDYAAGGERQERAILSLKNSIAACGMLGIPDIVIHGYLYGKDDQAAFEANECFYEKFSEELEKYNVYGLIENGGNAEYLLEAIKVSKNPRMKAVWDVGHANITGMSQYENITTLGEQLRAVHIHDNFGHVYSDKLEFKDIDTHMAPFAGTCNYDEIIQGLLDAEYKGYFTLEACNAMRWHESYTWNPRKLWSRDSRLLNPPTELRVAAEKLLYQTAKTMLETYHCFEE